MFARIIFSYVQELSPLLDPDGKGSYGNIAVNNVGARYFLEQTHSQDVALSFGTIFCQVPSIDAEDHTA